MKKLAIVVAIAVFLPSLGLASIDSNLKYNMSGGEVSELQDYLYDKGFLTTSPTGFFGVLTLKAVKAYQTSVKLPSTGFVGSMTRTEINRDLSLVVEESNQAEVAETGVVSDSTCTNGAVFNIKTGAYCPGMAPATTTVVYQTVYVQATSSQTQRSIAISNKIEASLKVNNLTTPLNTDGQIVEFATNNAPINNDPDTARTATFYVVISNGADISSGKLRFWGNSDRYNNASTNRERWGFTNQDQTSVMASRELVEYNFGAEAGSYNLTIDVTYKDKTSEVKTFTIIVK